MRVTLIDLVHPYGECRRVELDKIPESGKLELDGRVWQVYQPKKTPVRDLLSLDA